MTVDSLEFRTQADSVFGTLLTMTTILSGVYVSITFGAFAQAMLEPHPGEPMSPEMVSQATIGVFLGLIFIVPLGSSAVPHETASNISLELVSLLLI